MIDGQQLTIDAALRRLKNQAAGILADAKRHECFVKPSERRRQRKHAARKRAIQQAKERRFTHFAAWRK
jgi:ribosomal protein S21